MLARSISIKMMSGEGSHFLSSYNRRPSQRDSAVHAGDRNVNPYGVLDEKGSMDDRTGKGEKYEYDLPTVDGKYQPSPDILVFKTSKKRVNTWTNRSRPTKCHKFQTIS